MPKAFINTKRFERLLDRVDFQSTGQRNIIQRVTRKGGNVIKDEVKRLIPNDQSFPNVAIIRKAVKTVTSKSRLRPGVNVFIKSPDVPVGNRFWKASSFAMLLFYGNYRSPKRRKRGRGPSRGDVRGITGFNPFSIAIQNKGKKAAAIIDKNMLKEMQKEWRK